MARYAFQGTVRDELGNTLAGATVTVYLVNSATLADIYTAAAGGTAVHSVDSDTEGRFLFYVDTADYATTQLFKLVLSRPLSIDVTYDYIPCFVGAVHDRAHAITSASDHTSGATAGKMLKADADGLPVEASNTDIEVAAAVAAAHTALSNFPRVAASGTANAIAADFTPDLVLTDQPVCLVVALGANSSTTPTLVVDGGVPRVITKIGGTALLPGDIFGAGHVCIFKYDSTNLRWELLNPGAAATITVGSVSAVPYGTPPTVTNVGTLNAAILNFVLETGPTGPMGPTSPPVAAAAGTADAITGAYTPAITSLVDMLRLDFVAAFANGTTTPTFKADGTTAHTITKKGGSALEVGDIPGALAVCQLQYNLANTRWELLNPAPSAGEASVLVQIQHAVVSTVVSGSTILPIDNTIPQITEGVQGITRTITPKNAANHLLVIGNIVFNYASSASGKGAVALFKDADAAALAAVCGCNRVDLGYTTPWTIIHDIVAGGTSEITFRIRFGSDVAGTSYMNTVPADSVGFGNGVCASTLTVIEYTP
jgi:hypothetical protein